MDETKRKPSNVKIIQIITKGDSNYIFGLGDDSKVYMWLFQEEDWMLSA